MDLFRFRSAPNQPLRGGHILPRWPGDSITWAERYREPGEVTIVAGIASGLRSLLPVGTFVSHIDTSEIMRIEDHQIKDDSVTITGRSYEAPVLNNRIVGSNITFPTTAEPQEYVMTPDSTQDQAVKLVQQLTEAFYLLDDRDAIPYLETQTNILTGGTSEERKVAAGSLHTRLLEILAVDNYGVRSIRPGVNQTNTVLQIYKGADRSKYVVMSMERGEVVNTEYLESERSLKNCALVVGKFVMTRVVDNSKTGLDRRWMLVDASDIDENLEAMPPVGGARNTIIGRMQTRGKQALAKQKKIEMTKAEAAKDVVQSAIFRKHYNVGDIVAVLGGYGTNTKMRVTEHVEIEDETGFTAYPTLENLEEVA